MDKPVADSVDDPVEQVLASIAPLIRPGRIVMIGEWHGTNEFPRLVDTLASQAAQSGLYTVVGLGRSSQAIAHLVVALAALDSVTTVAMDGPWVAPGSFIPLELLHLVDAPQDETMARHLLDAMDRRHRPFTVFLAGSEHTKVGIDHHGGPSLGRYVAQRHPGALALLGRASGGNAWGLRKTMGEHGRLKSGVFPVPDDAKLSPGAQGTDRIGPDGCHGYVHIGEVTPLTPLIPEKISRTIEGEET